MTVAIPMSGLGNYGSPQTDLKSLGLEGGSDPWSMPPQQPNWYQNAANTVLYQASGAVPQPRPQAPSWNGMLNSMNQPPTMFPDPYTAEQAMVSMNQPRLDSASGLGGAAGGMTTGPLARSAGGAAGGMAPNVNLPHPAPNYSGTPVEAQWQAQQGVYDSQRRALAADRNRLMAEPMLRSAESGVLDAQEQQLHTNSAYLSEQTRALNARMTEQQQIRAAKNNVQDITNTARGQRERDVFAYRYQMAGLPMPIEVVMPEGYTGQMPPGVVERIQTLEQKLTSAFKDNEVEREFYLEAARIKSANSGQAVTAAQIRKGRIALTVDEMETVAKLLDLDVAEASIALNQTKQPSAPGLELDLTTGMWVDRNTAAINSAREKQRLDAEIDGQWGGVETGTLMTAMSMENPIIDERTFINALMQKGMSRETAQFYLNLALAQREARATSSNNNAALTAYLRERGLL